MFHSRKLGSTLCVALILACGGAATTSNVTAQPTPRSEPAAQTVQLPPMEPNAGVGYQLLAPVGWTGATEQQPLPDGSMVQGFTLTERAGAPDSPTVMVMVFPLFEGPATPKLFVDQIKSSFGALKSVSSATANGATTEVWSGMSGNIPASVAIRSGTDATGTQGMVVSFAAPTPRFRALGGVWMLDAIFPKAQPSGTAASPSQPSRPATAGSSPLEWHRCRCTDRKYGMTVPYTVCAADPLGAAYWETIAVACMPDGCRNCVCSPTYESCSQDGQML